MRERTTMTELDDRYEQAQHIICLSDEIKRYASTTGTYAQRAIEAAREGDDARWETFVGECRECLDAIVAVAQDSGESAQQVRWRKFKDANRS